MLRSFSEVMMIVVGFPFEMILLCSPIKHQKYRIERK